MARPGRNASPDEILRPDRTFFTTTKTFMGKRLLQTERNAHLLICVLRSLMKERAFELHDFVIMPDHVHLLLTVHGDTTVERAMQLVKGRFSYRLSHEFAHKGEVWQRGFSEVQVFGKQSFDQHRLYIAENPIKAGLVKEAEEYPFCFRTLAERKMAGAKAQEVMARCGTTEVVPCYKARGQSCALLQGSNALLQGSNALLQGSNALLQGSSALL